MALPDDLLDILVCPESKEPLLYFPRGEEDRDESEGFLFCPGSRLRYRIDDGIPVMLVEEADRVDETESRRLVQRAEELGLTS